MSEVFSEKEIDQIKGVKWHIENKLKEFNLTVGKLDKVLTQSYFVSGGCIASLIQGEQPKDYDIYFLSDVAAAPIINLYTNDPSYKNEVAVYDDKYRAVGDNGGKPLITENAITLKNGFQLITKHYGEPKDIRNTFDFIHCKPYYDTRDEKLYISMEQFDCCKNKILKMAKPDVSQYRIEKFKQRGYFMV